MLEYEVEKCSSSVEGKVLTGEYLMPDVGAGLSEITTHPYHPDCVQLQLVSLQLLSVQKQ